MAEAGGGEGPADLSARAHAAVDRVREGRPAPRGGLIGAITRLLGRRRSRSPQPPPLPAEADTAELHTLRSDLVRELERIAERAPASATAAEAPQTDAAG